MIMPAGAIVLLTSGISLVVAVVIVAAGLRRRRRMFAGPAWDRWQDARAGLSRRDEFRVRRATMRHRPVSAPGLVAPQLAYLGYARDTATRSPLRTKRWLRAAFPVMYALLGVSQLLIAVQPRPDLRLRAGRGVRRPRRHVGSGHPPLAGPPAPAPGPALLPDHRPY
jgi:hypothetical protein